MNIYVVCELKIHPLDKTTRHKILNPDIKISLKVYIYPVYTTQSYRIALVDYSAK